MSLAQLSKEVLRSPAQVAASIPALIGFTPTESIVIVMIESNVITVSMRIDIPADWAKSAEQITDTASRIGVDSVVVTICSELPSAWEAHRNGILMTVETLRVAHVEVIDALLIQENRYWSYLCDDDSAQGAVFFPEDSPLPAPKRMLRKDLADRYALRRDETPSAAASKAAQALLIGSVLQQAELAMEALEALSRAEGMCHGRDLRQSVVQVAVQNLTIRDWILTEVLEDSNCHDLVDAVTDAALTACDALRPRIAGLAAALLSATGSSTIPASCLIEHADQDSLAELINRAICHGVSPSEIRETFISAAPFIQNQLTLEEGSVHETTAP